MHSFVERDAFRQLSKVISMWKRRFTTNQIVSMVTVLTERGGEVSDVDKAKRARKELRYRCDLTKREEQGNNPVGFDLEGLENDSRLGLLVTLLDLFWLNMPMITSSILPINSNVCLTMQPINYLILLFGGYQLDGDLKPDVTLPGGMIYYLLIMESTIWIGGPVYLSSCCRSQTRKQALKERFPILAQNNYRF